MHCFDHNYVIPGAVAFYSLIKNSDPNHTYEIWVLHNGISSEDQIKLKETISPFRNAHINFLDMHNRFEDLFVFGDLIKGGKTNNEEYSDLNEKVYNELLNDFKSSDIVHLSGYRWHLYYRILLVNVLKQLDIQMHESIKSTYGSYDWNTHTF